MKNKTPEKIQELFNHIAPHYDQNNDIISLFLHRWIKRSVIWELPELPNEPKILDLCTGTGDIAKLLHKRYPNAQITGVDFSEEMLKIAREKHKNIKNIKFIEGDCLSLPFENETFDLVTISFGLRNTADYAKVVSEIRRVLKLGGKFVHIDFGQGTEFSNKVFVEIVKFIAQVQEDESYIYLLDSKNTFPSPEELIKLFEAYKLKTELRKDYLLGIISAQFCMKS